MLLLRRVGLLIIFVIIVILPLIEAKNVRGSISSTSESWTYLSKFCYRQGDGEFKVSLKGPGLTKYVTVLVTLDEEWESLRADMSSTCSERIQHSRLGIQGFFGKDDGIRVGSEISTTPDGFQDSGRRILSQVLRPHFWYVSILNCDIEKNEFVPITGDIEYKISFKQFDKSEFSDDEDMLTVFSVVLVIMLIFLATFSYNLFGHYKRFNNVHPVVALLTVCVSLWCLFIFCEWVHLYWYQYDGEGLLFFEFISELFHQICCIALNSIFLALANGWTISNHSLSNREATIMYTTVIVTLQMSLFFANRSYDDYHSKYHGNETIPGTLVIVLRLSQYIWFLSRLIRTYRLEEVTRQRFYLAFGFVVSIWFLSIPSLVLICPLFAQYVRHKVVLSGELLMGSGALFLLSKLFLTKSMYYKISTLSSSILPAQSRKIE